MLCSDLYGEYGYGSKKHIHISSQCLDVRLNCRTVTPL